MNFFLQIIEDKVIEERCYAGPARKGWWGIWCSGAPLAAATMKWCSSRPLEQGGGCIASSLHWTSGEQTFASSGTCLVKYHGIKPWREEGPREEKALGKAYSSLSVLGEGLQER